MRVVRTGATVLALLGVMSPSTVGANSSSATLAAGGLVLQKDDDIEMRSEDLFISMDEVRVRYLFVNTAPADKKITIAFPLPDVRDSISDVSFPVADADNFLAFSTAVNGRPVRTRVERRALLNGRDITSTLVDAGVPLSPFQMVNTEAMRRVPETTIQQWSEQGLYDWDLAAWTLKTTYFWEQTFPGGREVVVEHRYKPSVGSDLGTCIERENACVTERARYCVDDALVRAARSAKGDAGSAPFTEAHIEYILKTGGNWKKPIGDFRLVVDKGDPRNLVSFCADGVKKISPTQFEVRKRHWRPDRDLSILILKRH